MARKVLLFQVLFEMFVFGIRAVGLVTLYMFNYFYCFN